MFSSIFNTSKMLALTGSDEKRINTRNSIAMVDIKEIKLLHTNFLNWLKTKKEISNIDDFVMYVSEKYELYDKFSTTKDFRILKGITRSINRYRDEFSFDSESINIIYDFLSKIDDLINQLDSAQLS